MIVEVSKENCIRAAGDGDSDTVARYFEQQQLQPLSTKQHTPDEVPTDANHNSISSEHVPHASNAMLIALEETTRTLFDEAIANGQRGVVEVLLVSPVVRKCSRHVLSRILPDLLIAAIEEDYVDIVQCVLEHSADANAATSQVDATPLCKAAAMGSLDIVQVLVSHGANVSARDEATDRTGLHEAATQGDADVVDFLLAKGAGINVQDSKRSETPLICAVKKDNSRVVRKLIDAKAQLNVVNSFGSTALHIANVEGQREIRRLLEAAGAQVLEIPRTPRR
ncbi:Tkl protein kinase, partial [Globisporangium splendens]